MRIQSTAFPRHRDYASVKMLGTYNKSIGVVRRWLQDDFLLNDYQRRYRCSFDEGNQSFSASKVYHSGHRGVTFLAMCVQKWSYRPPSLVMSSTECLSTDHLNRLVREYYKGPDKGAFWSRDSGVGAVL